MRRALATLAALGALLTLGACAAQQQPEVMFSTKSPVELRAMQSREFETGDKVLVYRAILAMLQDLGYTITKVEPEAGTVSADKLAMLRLTATVYPRSETRTVVRSNAIVKLTPATPEGHQVDAPEFYQQRFFEPLSKALFLTALEVEDPAAVPEVADSKPAVATATPAAATPATATSQTTPPAGADAERPQ